MEKYMDQFDWDQVDLDQVGYMHICSDTCTDPCMYAFVCTSNYVRICVCVFCFSIVGMYVSSVSLHECMHDVTRNVCMMLLGMCVRDHTWNCRTGS